MGVRGGSEEEWKRERCKKLIDVKKEVEGRGREGVEEGKHREWGSEKKEREREKDMEEIDIGEEGDEKESGRKGQIRMLRFLKDTDFLFSSLPTHTG